MRLKILKKQLLKKTNNEHDSLISRYKITLDEFTLICFYLTKKKTVQIYFLF